MMPVGLQTSHASISFRGCCRAADISAHNPQPSHLSTTPECPDPSPCACLAASYGKPPKPPGTPAGGTAVLLRQVQHSHRLTTACDTVMQEVVRTCLAQAVGQDMQLPNTPTA